MEDESSDKETGEEVENNDKTKIVLTNKDSKTIFRGPKTY